MNKNNLIHFFKVFIIIYIFLLFKFIYLLIWGWLEHGVFYWFDDAFEETFKWSLLPFFIYVIYFIGGKKIISLISFILLLFYFIYKLIF